MALDAAAQQQPIGFAGGDLLAPGCGEDKLPRRVHKLLPRAFGKTSIHLIRYR